MKRTIIGIVGAAGLAFAGPAAAREDQPPGAALEQAIAAAERAIAAATPEAGIRAEAERFMHAYGRELIAGDRAAIARRYPRGRAWRVGHCAKSLQSGAGIEAFYGGEQWARRASFAWRGLSYEVLGPDAVVVVGLFEWGRPGGGEPLTLSYTGLLVRQDGELRIRLEDESRAR